MEVGCRHVAVVIRPQEAPDVWCPQIWIFETSKLSTYQKTRRKRILVWASHMTLVVGKSVHQSLLWFDDRVCE